ncbi:MAG: SCP2 sterol-binding domain-containing protein [Acidimicrobiales bacterium]
MTSWLSEEWFGLAHEIWADAPGLAGLSARVQCVVSGGPEGSVDCYWVIEDGRVGAGSRGQLDNAEVTLALTWDDALDVLRGDLDPNVAFMQGRMKVSGSMGVMIDLLSRARTPECREFRQRMAGLSGS